MKIFIDNIKKSLLGGAVLCLLLASCQEDDSIARRGKPTISIENRVVTVTEGETASFNLEMEYAVNQKVDIRIDLLDAQGNPAIVTQPIGSPDSGNGYERIPLEDINVPYPTWFEAGWFQFGYLGGTGYVATIAPYTKNFQIDIETLIDAVPEGTETFKFRLTATSLLEAVIDETITVNVQNFVGDELGLGLEWESTDATFDPCSMDMDIFLSDFSVFTFTGNCPEFLFNPTDPGLEVTTVLADGVYTVVADLWDNGGANFVTPPFDIPITVQIFKPGGFSTTLEYPNLYDSTHGESAGPGGGTGLGEEVVATIRVQNGLYTVLDRDGNIVARE
ncbi:hypothetical protein ACFQ1M_01150 [Sungkyunkwania multivorans]|uniref:Uncharacterized protein n=1 Tax=Sungkyunkwania multivorans TaxID=1173618 RepID=A0ABW3CT02_9FLAO